MSKYYPVSIEEMRDFLRVEKGWREVQSNFQNIKETVFEYPLRDYPQIVVKVYSGIKIANGQSRGCGKDAIRVCAVNTATNTGWISTSRVYRVEGWKANLKAKICEVINAAGDRARQYKINQIKNAARPIAQKHVEMSAILQGIAKNVGPVEFDSTAENEIYQIESSQR